MRNMLCRFLRADRASYGAAFALLVVPMFGTAALAVDFSNAYMARTRLQNALDTAALATAKELASSSNVEYLHAYANEFFDENISDYLDPANVNFSFSFSQSQTGGSEITISANYTLDTYLARAIGHYSFEMDVAATVTAGNRTAEIAVVIDNSGSMDNTTGGTDMTRIEAAQIAAANLINTLHTVAAFSNKPDPIRISVVPFAANVNIGPENRGADWMDKYGWSSVHHENIDWIGTSTNGDSWPDAYATGDGFKSPTTSTNTVGPNPPDPLPSGISAEDTNWLSRWTLMDALGVEWAGCVEMRPGYHATDIEPDELTPDTLFVPMFAPDEPDDATGGEDDDYENNYLSDFRRQSTDYPMTSNNSGSHSEQYDRQAWAAKYNSDAIWSQTEADSSSTRHRLGAERVTYFGSSNLGKHGPNQGCTTGPFQKLTSSSATAIAAVNAMQADGYTNVQAGIAWGWRALSPGLPFAEGRPYETLENDKYIIILTDGDNRLPSQATNNETEYYAWGYGKEDRVREGLWGYYSDTEAMDEQTALTCNNIKTIIDADGEPAYRIFTIAYDVPDGSSVKDLLYNCASTNRSGQKYYYDVEGAAIADAMAAIGNEISELRIAR